MLLIWFCRNAQICCTNKEISQYMELCLKNFCIYKINVLNESKFCVPYLPKTRASFRALGYINSQGFNLSKLF